MNNELKVKELNYLENKKRFFEFDNFNIDSVDDKIKELEDEYSSRLNDLPFDNNGDYIDDELNNIAITLNEYKDKKKVYLELINHDRDLIAEEMMNIKLKMNEIKDNKKEEDDLYLDNELAELNNKFNRLKKQYVDMYRNNIYVTLSRRRYLEKRQIELTEEIYLKKEKVEELKSKFEDDYNNVYLSTDISTLNNEIKDLEDKLKVVEDELEKYYSRLRKLQKNLEEKTKKYNELKSKINDNNSMYLNLELNELANEINTLKSKILKEQNLTNDLEINNKIEKLKNEINLNDNSKDEIEVKEDNLIVENSSESKEFKHEYSTVENEIIPYENKELEIVQGEEEVKDDSEINIYDVKMPENEIVVRKNSGLATKSFVSLASGFAVGLGSAFVLTPGTAGLVISVGRLAYAVSKKSIQVYTNKNQGKDTKIMKIIDTVEDKTNKFKTSFSENHPNIAKGIGKINNLLKKKEVQLFINGLAVGYTVGKIIDFAHVSTSGLQNESLASNDELVSQSEVAFESENTISENIGSTVVDPVNMEGTFDLSQIENGFVSSDAQNSVGLITDAGKNVTFDKAVVNSEGVEMWHFLQEDGKGYAWIPADTVKDTIGGRGI